MAGIDVGRVRDAANTDPEFRIAARFWNARIRLDVGDRAHLLALRDGAVAEFEAFGPRDPGAATFDVCIAAPAVEWDLLLAPAPRPFYHDLYAATVHHGFSMSGNLEAFYPYYPAMRRLVEIMRVAQ